MDELSSAGVAQPQAITRGAGNKLIGAIPLMEVGRSLRLACEKILFLLECKEVVAVINRLVAAVGARGGEEWSFLLEREKIGARL